MGDQAVGVTRLHCSVFEPWHLGIETLDERQGIGVCRLVVIGADHEMLGAQRLPEPAGDAGGERRMGPARYGGDDVLDPARIELVRHHLRRHVEGRREAARDEEVGACLDARSRQVPLHTDGRNGGQQLCQITRSLASREEHRRRTMPVVETSHTMTVPEIRVASTTR